jgi:hypothetical protein
MLGMIDEDRKRLRGSGGGNGAPAAKWWPIGESDLRYGISQSTVRRLVAEQVVIARKIGSRMIINDRSMEHYVISLPRAVIKPDDRSAKLARRTTTEMADAV